MKKYWFHVLSLKFCGKSKKICGYISPQSPAFCMYGSWLNILPSLILWKSFPETNIFSPGANEGKIWWSLHVDTLSQSQSAFWGKHVCWLLSFLRKSTKKCQIKCRVMHDYFFKCKLFAPLCLDMYPPFLHFFTTPWDIWRKQRNYGLHLMVFPCHHSSVQLSNCRNWVTQLFDFSAIKYILLNKKSRTTVAF